MSDGYREDLAYVHHAGFERLAANAAALLIEALRRGGMEDGLVVDLCCGSAPLSRRLSDASYDVLGVDISGAMVEMARERVPEGRFVEASIFSLALPPCVAVAAVGECFNYLFDEGNTEEGIGDLLGRIHAALVPGGVLIFYAAGPGRARPQNARRRRRLGGAGERRRRRGEQHSDPAGHHLPQDRGVVPARRGGPPPQAYPWRRHDRAAPGPGLGGPRPRRLRRDAFPPGLTGFLAHKK